MITSNTYDTLNRLTQVSYNTVSGVTTAPAVTYNYDSYCGTTVGSNVGEVSRFLNSQSFGSKHFLRGPYYNDPQTISVLLKYCSDERARELKATLEGYMVASIPDVSHDFFNKSSIIATFYFDGNDRLIDETVREELGK